MDNSFQSPGIPINKKIYFENIDGLRFFCFLSVFFYHSFHTEYDSIKNSKVYQLIKYDIFGNGNIGVNFFFVLSGFLITYLLIEEKKLNGKIHLGKFWLRRVLRIWPLFYLCVLFGFFIFPALKSAFGEDPNETASIGYYLTFLNNFDLILKGPPDASSLGVLWSVAIEEQFYLIWPIILFALPTKKYWIAFIGIISVSVVYRFCNEREELLEFHTLSCIGDMAIGALGAWAILVNRKSLEIIRHLKTSHITIIYVSFVSIYFFGDEIFFYNHFLVAIERPLTAIVILLIILEQNFSTHSWFKISRFSIASKLGRISYGLYCFHFVGILVATTVTQMFAFNTSLWQVMVLDTLLALSITILISIVIYRFYEVPFLKLKSRFSY